MDEIGDEFNDTSGNDKTVEELPELANESDELNEFDDIIPEVFSEPDEFDDDIPEVFSEPDEFDDILDDTIHDNEVGERADEDQDSGDVGNVVENENIGPQSTSTILTSEIEEIEGEMELQEQEEKEEIEIRPEEYQDDTEPIVNTDESEFIKDVEELAEYARETKGEDESVEPHAEQENAAYYAEQYFESLKEKEVLNEKNSKEEQETEELMQEVAEELKGDQESGYKSDELEKEDISEASKEITSTEEFEYLWEVRDKLDREGKQPEEIEEVMHEAEEMYETLKNAEKLYEEQELEKLKLVDHEDEANEEDLKEELDRGDLVEQAVELEDNLFQQGELQEEIDARVEESIETTKFEESLEKIIETQELEKLKLVDHEDEANEEDLKEELDRIDLVKQAVELEENLVQQGKSQEEIDTNVEEAIETTKFEESLEEIIESQELEKLKLVDHEDEEDIDDAREEIDRPAEAEYYMEVEEELHRQGMSQEEIDEQMEEIASNYQIEINKKQEKEEDPNVSEELEKHDLETNEQNSNAEQCDQIELTSALSSEKKEESIEEEDERLQELYRQETGRRPIYASQKSKGYKQWLEQRELRSEKPKNSKSESEKKKEIEEEGWKTTLKRWIKEASEEEYNVELKSELKKALESYNEFEDLTRKFLELYKKSQHEKLSEKENNRLKSLIERLQELGPIQLELLANIRAFKDYFNNNLWQLMNRFFANRVRSKFFKHISQKFKFLKQEILKLKELINANNDIIPEETQSLVNKEMEPPNIPNITLSDPIGKNSTYIKNSFLWEYIKTRDKSILNEHTTIDLLADLYIEINRYPQILASIFPDRVNRFPERELSVIWGKYETFITKWKRLIRDNKQEGFRGEDLELLRINLKRHLGNKADICSKIINLYKSGKLTYIEFIDQLTKELGRYSYRLPLTMEEFSLILGGYVNFTNDILGKINNPSHQRYNPNYKFSIERLDDIKDNIQTILGDKAKKIFKIIRKYKNFNPDLKKFKHQQHTIDNPRFFKIIDLILNAYLFGFMCADGYRASKSYRIGIELKSDDKDRLILFAKSIGLDINRIRSRVRFYHINGVLKSSQMSVLSFICKDMHNDLANNQYSSSKADRKYIPNCILDAIHKAKQEALEMRINWMDTYWGMVALAWLLGYYDGDGTLDMRGNQMSARIYSASKQFLEQIREAFGIRNNVLTNTEPGEVRIVFGKPIVSRGYYLLTLGVKVFIGMLHSFSDSMQRKRPLKYRNSTD